ncbi:Hypothetical predicted protein [Mytilus galloprovincialis]|uniref:Uncharacterized protein n=1 Tax=Mytilus galloprovincialis TaxID=29158 RepID=A0A8B6EGZ0_MYTGA|nr:Hypothetical predicted protein [Mytilus galloprovincialis]
MTRVSGGNTPIFTDESTMPRHNDSYNEEEITAMRQGDTIPRWEMNREAHQSTLHTDNRRPNNQSTENTVPSENRETYQRTWSTGHSDNRDAYQSAWNTDHSDMRENPSTWSTDHSERRELNRTSGQSNREHQSTHSTVERERCEMNRHEQQRMDYSEVADISMLILILIIDSRHLKILIVRIMKDLWGTQRLPQDIQNYLEICLIIHIPKVIMLNLRHMFRQKLYNQLEEQNIQEQLLIICTRDMRDLVVQKMHIPRYQI